MTPPRKPRFRYKRVQEDTTIAVVCVCGHYSSTHYGDHGVCAHAVCKCTRYRKLDYTDLHNQYTLNIDGAATKIQIQNVLLSVCGCHSVIESFAHNPNTGASVVLRIVCGDREHRYHDIMRAQLERYMLTTDIR